MVTGRTFFGLPRSAVLVLCSALLAACAEDDNVGNGPAEPEPAVEWVTLACDPIAPAYCGFPFPSNVFTVDDPATVTGRRVQLSPEAMPVSYYGQAVDPVAWSRSDGFSVGGGIMVHLPGATSNGLPGVTAIDQSLAEDSPTVLLDTETGERLAHYSELDATTDDPTMATMFIRPARVLDPARRYIVAIRGVRDAAGDPLPPSPAFEALRDVTPMPDDPTVDDRRPLYADIFARLGDAAVERDDLQLAWDFTTASDENNTAWLLHMRDESFAKLGDAAPSYEITTVEEDFDPRVLYRIRGTFEVPLYLDVPGPVSIMNFGPDKLPEPTGNTTFEFTMMIPASAANQPAKLLQFGHGLLGTQAAVESDVFLDFMDTYGYAMFSTDWIGLAEPDEAFLGVILDSGRVEEFEGMFARNMQAVLNALLLNRVVTRGFAQDETYGRFLDASQNYYYGISLGGILGTLYLTLSTDVTRGAADVMGAPFNTLLTRSRAFDAFFSIARSTYSDPRDIHYVLGLIQLFWDRAEPNGFLKHLRDDPFAGTPAHDLMMRAAIGDHTVNTAGAHYQARSLGAPHVDTGTRAIYGLESTPQAEGLGFVEYDFGLPEDPKCNIPQRACKDTHGALVALGAADEQLDQFLRTGTIGNTCGGACSYPERGECAGGETNAVCMP